MLHTPTALDRTDLALASEPPRRAAPRQALTRALVLASASGSAYGAWAALVNASHGPSAALRAALAQCATSFASTFLMVVLLERLFVLGRTPREGFWLAAVGTTSASASLMATTHALAGTPRILATIAPLVCVAGFVYTMYALGLFRAARRLA